MTWGGLWGNLLWLLKWPVCALERAAELKAMLMRGERHSIIHTAEGGDYEAIRYWKRRLEDKSPPAWLTDANRRRTEIDQEA